MPEGGAGQTGTGLAGRDDTPWKRSKRIAVLLAVFLGPWTWLYTYRRDPGKAALGLGFNVSAVLFLALAIIQRAVRPVPPGSNAGESLVYVTIGLFLWVFFPTWLVAIMDAGTKRVWQLSGPEKRRKGDAIIFGLLLGPWTWLYT